MTELTLTAIFEEAEEAASLDTWPNFRGPTTQGETLEEARENLSEAIELILTSNREESQSS